MKRKKVVALLIAASMVAGSVIPVYAASYNDVPENAKQYVNDVEGIMDGVTKEKFGVTEEITISVVSKALYSLAGSPSGAEETFHGDTEAFEKAVSKWIENNEIYSNIKDTVEDTSTLTRQELAQVIYDYAGMEGKLDMAKGLIQIDSYKDYEETDETYREALSWAFGNKILLSDELTTDKNEEGIRPETMATRLDLAIAIANYKELVKEQEAQGVISEDLDADCIENQEQNDEKLSYQNTNSDPSTLQEKPSDNSAAVTPDEPTVDAPDTPAETPDEPTIDVPDTPAETPDEPAVDVPDTPAETPNEPAVDVPDTPAETPNEPTVDVPDTPAETPDEPAVDVTDTPAETPDDPSVDVPDTPTETPDEPTVDVPDTPAETPDDPSVDVPDTPTETPDDPSVDEPVHEHVWENHYITITVPEVGHMETITHEEQGHYETVSVPEAGHNEFKIVSVCDYCGAEITGFETAHIKAHALAGEPSGWHDEERNIWVVDVPAHEENQWVVDQEAYTEDVWVVDIPEHTEKVVDGMICTECGELK